MATQEQLDEISKEANAVIAARVSARSMPVDESTTEDELTDQVGNLKAAIRELAVIARSHAPMQQEARIVELLALAE